MLGGTMAVRWVVGFWVGRGGREKIHTLAGVGFFICLVMAGLRPDFLAGALLGGMFPIAVGAFDLQVVDLFNALRIAQNVIVAAANVAAEQEAVRAMSVANVEDDLRGAKDVTGIAKSNGDTVEDRE